MLCREVVEEVDTDMIVRSSGLGGMVTCRPCSLPGDFFNWDCFANTNGNMTTSDGNGKCTGIATPNAPWDSRLVVPPASEVDANATVTEIVNQQMIDQQAMNAQGVNYVNTYGIPPSLIMADYTKYLYLGAAVVIGILVIRG